MTRLSFISSAVILLAGILFSLSVSGIPAGDPAKLMAEGKTLLDLGQNDEARATFLQVLDQDPENPEARAYLNEIGPGNQPDSAAMDSGQEMPGDEMAIEGDDIGPDESPQELERVGVPDGINPTEPDDGSALELESEPEPFRGHEDMVVPVPFEEQVSGEPQEEQIEQPESDVPESPTHRLHYYYRKGLDAFEEKNYPEAIHNFEKVQELDAGYRRADYYRRESWNRLADRQGASVEEERTEEQPAGKESYDAYARGKEYMRYGKYEAAIREFQKVLDKEPDHQGAKALLEEARLKIEKTDFEDEVAAAEQLAREEEKFRSQAQAEEGMAVREAYHEGEQLYKEGELESSRRKFSELETARGTHRRSSFYLRKIDKELWEKKEDERVDFEAEAIGKYTLGPEDVVRVVVRNHPEFNFMAPVEEGGELIIPLTNEIMQVQGMTRDELAEEIRQYLTAFIDNPFVSVFITGYGSKKYYVLQPTGGGAEYVMNKASMTLWEAMFQAGIPQLDQAAMRRVQVITPHKTHPTHRWINVYAMLYEGKMEDNIRIEPGTIIYYPALVVVKFANLVSTITKPITSLTQLGTSYEQWDKFRKDYLR